MIDNPFSLLSWHDGVEIVIISYLFYRLSVWLKSDQHKSLVPLLYGYTLFLFASYLLPLQTLNSFLLAFSPALLMVFILLHQKTLQKNFVAFKTIAPAKIVTDDWLEVMIRASLVSLSKKKKLMFVIERNHSLHEFTTTSCTINAELHKPLLDMVLESALFDQSKFLLINSNGTLLSANSSWHSVDTDYAVPNLMHTDLGHQAALMVTAKTDALVICANPESKSCTLIIGGTVVDQLNAAQLFTLIKKYLRIPSTAYKQGDINHAAQSQKYSTEQQQP